MTQDRFANKSTKDLVWITYGVWRKAGVSEDCSCLMDRKNGVVVSLKWERLQRSRCRGGSQEFTLGVFGVRLLRHPGGNTK